MDINSQSTDCYKQAGKVAAASDSLLRSGQEFTSGLWMRPVQRLNEFMIELTNQFETCKTTDFAKQLGTRTSSLSGALDLAVTVGMGIAMAYVPGADDKSKGLYNSLVGYGTAESCAATSRNLGQALSRMFNTKVPDEYFAEQLTYQIKDQVVRE